MLFFYSLAINLIFLISPIMIIYRVFKKKEDPKRFLEKIGIIPEVRKREFYEKPTSVLKRKKAAAVKKSKKIKERTD